MELELEDSDGEREWRAKGRPGKQYTPPSKEGESSGDEDEVVAVIHPHPSPKSRPKEKTGSGDGNEKEATLFFPPSDQTWHATCPVPRMYRFHSPASPSTIFTWESRPPSRSSSSKENSPRFGLSVEGPGGGESCRNACVAQLTPQGFRIGALELILHGSEFHELEVEIKEVARLYTLVITMGVWIAKEEGWFGC